jgi:hypothetical protein
VRSEKWLFEEEGEFFEEAVEERPAAVWFWGGAGGCDDQKALGWGVGFHKKVASAK